MAALGGRAVSYERGTPVDLEAEVPGVWRVRWGVNDPCAEAVPAVRALAFSWVVCEIRALSFRGSACLCVQGLGMDGVGCGVRGVGCRVYVVGFRA